MVGEGAPAQRDSALGSIAKRNLVVMAPSRTRRFSFSRPTESDMSRRWWSGFGRLAFACPVSWSPATARAGRAADDGNSVATLFGFDRRGQDHPRRLFTPFRPSAHVRGDAPPWQQAISAVGWVPCPVFPVLFVTSSAWATKGFFFSSLRSSSEIPPRGRASGLEPCEGPVDPTQGDREWTNVEDGFSRAGSGESQPTVYLESCPVWIPSPLKAPPLRRNRKQRPVPAQWPPLGLR